MTANEIRHSFLEYFERQGHRIVPSSPLVPQDDPTLLFTNAGMNQFKDVFLGREQRAYRRAATSQKVMRVSGKHNDLDNVGPSFRHHTFFEMLGNFSFGDYFKEDAIAFAWELLTGVWRMPAERLVVSIFKGDDQVPRDEEAYAIWRRLVPADRILELGAEDNFWSMGDTGPCGRCSEVYYVRGSGSDPEIEVWNNVFMEFDRAADGTLAALPARSIDTGMGLERITAVLQQKDSNYDTDLFMPILRRLGEMAGVTYGATASRPSDVSMRVVADHIRATTFLIADGVIPSNEWRGYVLRKIMRRAMRHGKHLGLAEPFLFRLVDVLDREMGDAYPELRRNREMVEKTILAEEHRFEAVLTEGLPRLEQEIDKIIGTRSRVLSGDAAFRLYDTFGVPYDFIEDTAATQGATVDREGFDRAMEGQRQRARAGSSFDGGTRGEAFTFGADDQRDTLTKAGDRFEGYTATEVHGVRVLALFDEARRSVDELPTGGVGYALLDRTPFYLEAGGQVSDVGRLSGAGVEAAVDGIVRVGPGLPRAHRLRVERGRLKVHDLVTAESDAEVRDATRRNHTATHLLHAALREVLGSHVKQAGSLVAPDRLRFDFVHFQPVTREELDRIERIVNEQIVRNTPVQTEIRSTQEAIAAGAMALFGEKYGDQVRVVSVPGFSMELCGGTHVRATGDIGSFFVTQEGGVAAGVRRIEALTGLGAVQWAQAERAALEQVVAALRVNRDQAVEAIEKLQAEQKKLAREVTDLKTKVAMGGGGGAEGDAGETVDIDGVRLMLVPKALNLDKKTLRSVADAAKSRIGSGIVVAANTSPEAALVVVSVTPDLTERISAGDIVKALAPIIGGRGGGRRDFAEAGGKNPEGIDDMRSAAPDVVRRLLQPSGAQP
jgi:alanyl-tRNA synthetase